MMIIKYENINIIITIIKYLIALILELAGSKTPAFKLFLHLLLTKSKPQNLSSFFFSSSLFWLALWSTLNWAIKSIASRAALFANVLGITNKASQNSLIAIYSLLPKVFAKSSK